MACTPSRAWLWVAVTAWVTVFVVRPSRGAKVAQEPVGERFRGILVTDRWSAYTWYPTRWRQVCWAHLLRDFEAMIERGGPSQEVGEGLREQTRQMFHAWHRVRDGRWLKVGQTCGVAKTEGVCREVRKLYDALGTFVRVEGVEPTNNAAEVRFVDQKPTFHKVWGIGPEFKSVKALGLENLMPVSV